MCGIVGLLGHDTAPLRAMLKALRHRGPDHEAVYEDAKVALGHARLSIIDPSPASHQPMVDPGTGCVIAYNGEIYNFRELRGELERDHKARFETSGDTEVILRGYVAEGPSFFSKLNGIFALALWDPRAGSLVLARDPVGVKPLYTHLRTGGGLAFASEAKALYPVLESLTVDEEALGGYFLYHYAPGTRTIIHGIERFPAGEVQVYAIDGRLVRRHEMDRTRHARGDRPLDPASLWRTLSEAVERQMVADVPVGSFLSGGIDSSIVTFLAQNVSDAPLNTFSVGFDHETDERALARAFADSVGTRHHEVEVRGEQVIRDLGDMAWHFDGPLGEAGCIPNYYVSKEAAKHVKVVLAGEGSDELFGGYNWYAYDRRLSAVARFIPKSTMVAAAAMRLPGKLATAAGTLVRPTRIERYASFMEWFRPDDVAASGLPTPRLLAMNGEADCMTIDRSTLLRDCYLEKADKMTMAHGLEERVPFLDLEVMAFADRIPLSEKLARPEKRFLREAARGHLPELNVARPKRGYGTPLSSWMNVTFPHEVERALDRPIAVESGLMSREAWTRLAHRARTRHQYRLKEAWLLLALDVWLRELARRGSTTYI